MNSSSVNHRQHLIPRYLVLVIVAAVLILGAYTWHRSALAQSASEPPEAVLLTNGKIALHRGELPSFSIITVDQAGLNESNLGVGVTPSWSFDGSKIVFAQETYSQGFVSSSAVWIMDGNGANRAAIIDAATNQPLQGGNPQISPDGKRLVFTVFDYAASASSVVCVMDLTFGSSVVASNRQTLTGSNEFCFTPAWQPLINTATGKFTRNGAIAFVRSGNDNIQHIFLINADGTGRTDITDVANSNNADPSFSYDGTKMVFNSDRDQANPPSLYIVNMNGAVPQNPPKKLTKGFYDSSAKFSPDGKFIVYVSSVENNGDALFVADITDLNPDGTVKTPVRISSGHEDSAPSWGVGAISSPTPTPTPTATPTPAQATLQFDGLVRDRVRRQHGAAGLAPDGDADGTFTLTLPSSTIGKHLSSIDLCQKSTPCAPLPADSGINRWDTIPADTSLWVLGVDYSPEGSSLQNDPNADGSVNGVSVTSQAAFKLYVGDAIPTAFVQGNQFSVTVRFTDNTSISATTAVTQTPAVDLAITTVAGVPNNVAEGQDIVYQIAFKNIGTKPATGVLLFHTLQVNQFNNPNELFDGYSIVGATGRCTLSANFKQVQCNLDGSVLPGQIVQVDITLHFLKAIPGAGSDEFVVGSNQSDANTDDNRGSFSAIVHSNAAPANDNVVPLLFKDPTLPATESGGVTGTNVGATYEGCKTIGTVQICEPLHAGVPGGPECGKSVWWSWQAPRDGNVTFTTAASKFDTTMAVYYLEDLQILTAAQNDDSSSDKTSSVSFDALQNNKDGSPRTYFIAVDGYHCASGDINLSWKMKPQTDPATIVPRVDKISPNVAGVQDVNPQTGLLDLTVNGVNFSATPGTVSSVLIDGFDIACTNAETQNGCGQTLVNSPTQLSVSISRNYLKQVLQHRVSVRNGGPRVFPPGTPQPGGAIESMLHATTSSLTPDDVIINGVHSSTARILSTVGYNAVTVAPGQTQTISASVNISPYQGGGCVDNPNALGCKYIQQTTLVINCPASQPAPGCVVTPADFAFQALNQLADSADETVSLTASYMLSKVKAYNCDITCAVNQLNSYVVSQPVSVNPQVLLDSNATIDLSKALPIDPSLLQSALMVAQGPGLISQDGSNIVGDHSSGLISQDGSNIISEHGAGGVAVPAGVVSNDGGSLVSHDGGSIAPPASNTKPPAIRPGDFIHQAPNLPLGQMTASQIANQSGLYVVNGSGGNSHPSVTGTTGPDGAPVSSVGVKLDSTSSPSVTDLKGVVFAVVTNPAVLKLASNNISVSEGAGGAVVTVTRSGNVDTPVTVDYGTGDGTAQQRRDYTAMTGTLSFAPGETTRSFTIPITDNGNVDGSRTVIAVIGNAQGGAVMIPNTATVTITDNDSAPAASNPADDAQFFARQHYYDLLNRVPTPTELATSASPIIQCGSDAACVRNQRLNVSSSFFTTFAQTGSYVERMFKALLNRRPTYAEFNFFHNRLLNATNLTQAKLDVTDGFVYLGMVANKPMLLLNAAGFVDTINSNAGNVLTQAERNALVSGIESRTETFTTVLQKVADNQTFVSHENNSALAMLLYFGYLRRDTDAQYATWLQKLNQGSSTTSVIDSFVNSTEYRTRFGASVCAFTLTSSSASYSASGGAGSINLLAAASDCPWIVTSNAGFITLTSPASGTGFGSVSYSVAANTGASSRSGTITIAGQTFTVNQSVGSANIQFNSASYSAGEGDGKVTVTVTRSGDTASAASVRYATSDGTAKEGKDYVSSFGLLNFAAGETSKTFPVLVIDNGYVGGNRTVNLTLSNATGASLSTQSTAVLTITDNDASPSATNPLDQQHFFVQEHYYDFLGRYPDQAGWDFWTSQITNCGANQSCIDASRVSVSASFFLSIEFQQTGYLVEKMYKAAYGDATGSSFIGGTHSLPVPIVRFNEFLPDTAQIGSGVIVGQTGWETVLENNKQAFAADFVQRSRFTTALSTTMSPAQFVDKLFQNAGVTPTANDRTAAINEFNGAATTTDTAARGRALRRVAENSTFDTQEFNRAFVLMQYFGYLRRDPNGGQDTDHSGYEFWLTKLNAFNGNFINAEMVKAFITSIEYRQRFSAN